jgi:hypothetical protein
MVEHQRSQTSLHAMKAHNPSEILDHPSEGDARPNREVSPAIEMAQSNSVPSANPPLFDVVRKSNGSQGCVVGKIYVDCTAHPGSTQPTMGIPGVRIYFSDGTFVISDSEGKYSYCGLRPSTHTIKVDRTTLPLGARLVATSNRNALDAGSLFVDPTFGEVQQADFAEGSCSDSVLAEVTRRRAEGEVSGPEKAPAMIFESKPGSSLKMDASNPTATGSRGAPPSDPQSGGGAQSGR